MAESLIRLNLTAVDHDVAALVLTEGTRQARRYGLEIMDGDDTVAVLRVFDTGEVDEIEFLHASSQIPGLVSGAQARLTVDEHDVAALVLAERTEGVQRYALEIKEGRDTVATLRVEGTGDGVAKVLEIEFLYAARQIPGLMP